MHPTSNLKFSNIFVNFFWQATAQKVWTGAGSSKKKARLRLHNYTGCLNCSRTQSFLLLKHTVLAIETVGLVRMLKRSYLLTSLESRLTIWPTVVWPRALLDSFRAWKGVIEVRSFKREKKADRSAQFRKRWTDQFRFEKGWTDSRNSIFK